MALQMTNFTIQNIPDELYAQITASATHNGRSVHDEILIWLARAASLFSKESSEKRIARARVLRNSIRGFITNADEITAAKNEGRLTGLDQNEQP